MDDKATVPLFYEKRVPKVLIQNEGLNEEFCALLEEEYLDAAQQDMHSLRMIVAFVAVAAATFGTVFHLIPTGRPFFAPCKRVLADGADFLGEVGFAVGHGGAHPGF